MTPIDRARAYMLRQPPAISGQRGHDVTFSLACKLVNGFELGETEALSLMQEYNQRCQPPWGERELQHKVAQALRTPHERPSGYLLKSVGYRFGGSSQPKTHRPRTVGSADTSTGKQADYKGGSSALPDALDNPARRLIEATFEPGECIGIAQETLGEDGRGLPKDAGPALTRETWLAMLAKRGGDPNKIFSSTSKTGAFIRVNPLKDGGSKDSDVTAFRHVLLEFDEIAPEEQWSLIQQSNLPCAAVLHSGNRSLHAWVRIDAETRAEYDERVKFLFDHFAKWNPDEKNKNPSRFSRLPGMVRGDKRQELLALNVGAPSWKEWSKTKNEFRKELDKCKFDSSRKPPEVRPVYLVKTKDSRDAIIISTPQNITTLNAGPKRGKSAMAQAMIASTFSDDGADTLGVVSNNESRLALVHFDTEQAPDDHWNQVVRIVRRAKAFDAPSWLESYCLTGKASKHRWDLINYAISDAHLKFNGIHSIFIDGVADLVDDVNDPKECNPFVDELHGLAIQYDCPIIAVIHFNPETTKSRGHLGSQLERKAETNLRMDKDGEIISVWSEKQRRAPIRKGRGPRFTWSDEAGMHVTCDDKIAIENKKTDKYSDELDDVFREKSAMTYTEMIKKIMEMADCAHKTAEKRHAEYKKFTLIKQSIVGKLWERTTSTSTLLPSNNPISND